VCVSVWESVLCLCFFLVLSVWCGVCGWYFSESLSDVCAVCVCVICVNICICVVCFFGVCEY